MADTQFHGLGDAATPSDWVIPGALELTLKAAQATYDTTGAAGPVLPALEIISDAGLPVGLYVSGTAIPVGVSAEVSFAPFLESAAASSSGSGIQYDVDNSGTWLDVATTGFEPVDGNGMHLKATGDGNPITVDSQGGVNVNDQNGWGIVLDSTTGTGGSADLTAITGRDQTYNAGRTISMQAASFLNLAALDTLTAGATNKVELTSNGTGGINVQVNSATGQLFIQGTPGALIVLDPSILPVAAPATSGALWNNAGVVHVVP